MGIVLIVLGLVIFLSALVYDFYNMIRLMRDSREADYSILESRIKKHAVALKAMLAGTVLIGIGIGLMTGFTLIQISGFIIWGISWMILVERLNPLGIPLFFIGLQMMR